ncbi:MAG: hypothetical protein GF353_26910 [Candidatus Lokiarchaeota archaeon]|nr:hypothetical protein [Candidatus Lokiarchaeota archaeon]
MSDNLLFIGHRGTRVIFDENTYQAFDKAIEYGANYIETDIRKTFDQRLILIHDETVDRTTTGKGLVREMIYPEIKELNTLNQARKIPLLIDLLKKYRNTTNFIFDLKEENILNDIIGIIRRYNWLKRSAIVSGRVLDHLITIKKRFPEIQICYNITKAKKNNLDDFLKQRVQKPNLQQIDLINLRSELITPEFIKRCDESCITPLAWDFLKYGERAKTKIKSLVEMGVRGILFDDYHNILKVKNWIKDLRFV